MRKSTPLPRAPLCVMAAALLAPGLAFGQSALCDDTGADVNKIVITEAMEDELPVVSCAQRTMVDVPAEALVGKQAFERGSSVIILGASGRAEYVVSFFDVETTLSEKYSLPKCSEMLLAGDYSTNTAGASHGADSGGPACRDD